MKKELQKSVEQKPSMGDITRILTDPKNPESLRTVIDLAYPELHRMARGIVRKPRGHTWQPTAVLHQSCLRLLENDQKARKRGKRFKNRHHFFGAAAIAMRRVLVDEARKRHAEKRGGKLKRVEFQEAERLGFENSKEVLDFHVALERLEESRPDLVEITELRVFEELTISEIATVLGIAQSSARRRWATARKQLAAILKRPANHHRD
jgi:RNA polymerase sigma factor (TIGR02999 family)